MFARTERLVLRPGWMEDAPALVSAIGDEAVVRNLARVPFPYSEDDARAFLALPVEAPCLRFLAFSRTKAAPRLIGCVGISDREDGRLELGYWIARPYWGLGFATEAARATMRIARAMGLSDIVSSHFIDNPASGNVLRKVGFRPTGQVEQRFSLGRGESVASAVFEQAEEVDMPSEVHFDLYSDTPPLAA